ncbi:MAG: acetolactate synthase small subunit [Pyrinomonadaceae bacterium]|nr:acetolactate synthase small subunit [Pyrinomonadaceae bacterium]
MLGSELAFILHPSAFILENMRHTLSIVVADQAGELSRIVGLFSARGFNIETISVGQTLDPQWSRVTIVTRGDDRTIEQIVKQCSRLARVREVEDVTMQPHIEREMALIDVAATPGATRQEVLSLVGVFRAKVVDISQTGMIVEASGNKEKVEALIELLRPMGIRDIIRTGCIAIGRLSNIEVGPPPEGDSFEFRVPGFDSGAQKPELKA